MKKYFAYIRVSTTRQGELGVSLQQQKDAIDRYSSRLGLEITEWFEEQETAAKSGRPLFGQMLKLLRRGKAAGVIIHKIDRSARNLSDWADLGTLIDSGIELHFASEALDLQSRGGRLSADIQAVVASDFIRNLREETKKGFYGRLKQGLLPMPAPVGYADVGKGKPKELHPTAAPLVKQAFELYATGRFNLHSLNEEIRKLGLRSRTGKGISINGLSTMLRNPFYMGLIRIKKNSETYQGVHTPLISKALFDRVQYVLDGRLYHRSISHDFTYRRLLRCRTCNYSLIGEERKGHIYYRCHTPACPTTCVREEPIDLAVLNKLKAIELRPKEIDFMKELLCDMTDNSTREREQLAAALQLKTTQMDARLNRLTDAYIDRLIDKDSFEERKKALLMERLELKEKLNDLEGHFASVAERLLKILELAKDAYSLYQVALSTEKREILLEVTSNRIISGKSINFTYFSPYQEIANRYETADGSPQRGGPRIFKLLLNRLVKFLKRDIPSEKLPLAA
jgi:DNA invertase Pin-like site-specific DNA recombinase